MKFVCDRCQTKYAIADEKVRGRILKVRCKNCSNIVVVKESAPAPVSATSGGESERTVINSRPYPSGISSVAASPAAAAKPRPVPVAAPAPPPPAPEDDVQWFLALEGVQKGPFARKVLIDKLMALARDADVHVWNENLDGWKPPQQVPVVARDLQARQRAAAPPPPPLRPRAVPPPPSQAAMRATGGMPSGLPSPAGSLPGSGSTRLPAAMASAGAEMLDGMAAHGDTPPPIHDGSGSHALHAKNGVDGHASGPVAAAAGVVAAAAASRANGDSDALIALNLGGAWRNPAAVAPGAVAEWQQPAAVVAAGPAGAPGRQRNLKLIAAFIGIVGVCVVVLFNFVLVKKPPALPPADKSKVAGANDGLAKLADQLAKENAVPAPAPDKTPAARAPELAPASPPVATAKPDSPGKVSSGSRKSAHGKAGKNASIVADTTPPPLAPVNLTPEQQAAAARFGDTSRRTVQVRTAGGSGARTMPDPSEISRVVNNNKSGIKICYQRALLRDSSLTHGKITVHVSIGLSGRVKNISVDGPAAFRVVEPCIRDVLSRWVFPSSSEEYSTEFSSVFQGNE